MKIFDELVFKVQGQNKAIVFPESNDVRVLAAAGRLANDNILKPILIGDNKAVAEEMQKLGYSIDGCQIVDPNDCDKMDYYADELYKRRNGKLSAEDAQKLIHDVNYLGTMLVYLGEADGMVSGAIHSTGDTVRPALQIIKTKPGISKVSGAFLMLRDDEKYIFSDCAINVDPDANELAGIALDSAKTAEMFGIDPTVAMLSFSTKGSAKALQVDKVVNATKMVQEMNTNDKYVFDGELQFDAAFVETVGKLKAPDSNVAGQAKVFVFPDLQSGNIGYKIAQRLGGFEAVGPILQGLNKPISDLSRGCNVEDVYKLSIITAAQSLIDDNQ